MPVFIYESDAFSKIIKVEGGVCDRFSFDLFLREWERLFHLNSSIKELGLATTISVEGYGAIYGFGGVNRYVVFINGEIMFHKFLAGTPSSIVQARNAGFRVFPDNCD